MTWASKPSQASLMVAATTPPATATPPSALTSIVSRGQALGGRDLRESPSLPPASGVPRCPRRPCHPRATPDGHGRYPADSHGQYRAANELVSLARPA